MFTKSTERVAFLVMAMSSLISFSVTMIKLLLMLLKLNLVLLLPLMLALKTPML